MAGSITGTLTTDKSSYNAGDIIHVTIVRHAIGSPVVKQAIASGTLTDTAGDSITLASDPITVTTPGGPITSTIASVTDSDGRTFVKVTDDGVTWTGTATA